MHKLGKEQVQSDKKIVQTHCTQDLVLLEEYKALEILG